MNTNYGNPSNPQRGSVSLNNFEFDFGIGSSTRARPLNDQKPKPSSNPYSFSSTQSKPATSSSSWQPNKPSWTHQPAPSLSGAPTSMVGDIFGKSWNSTSGSGSGIGIVEKNPNLFGDLVNSALGQGKSGSGNVPLKSAAPVSNPAPAKSAYSMGNLADSLPKTGNSGSYGGYSSGFSNGSSGNKSNNLGGPSMRGMGGGGGGMGGNKDPFGSLVDFGSKPGGSMNAASKGNKTGVGNDGFGDFQDASKSSTAAFSSNAFPAGGNDFMSSKVDDFGMPTKNYDSRSQTPVETAGGGDPLDMLFSSSSGNAGAAPAASEGTGSQQFSGVDDWGLDSEFGGGHDSGGTTTELEGLPPPPAGVTASAAKNKGMDNHKQGQFADAIKWLSWAVILFEKAGDDTANMEVLSCRALCYKEVGEYKKAVADCTKVLEHDGENVDVLVQRALLYESMEKYKLGAEDLRTVMKIDPGNRIARSTIHRLTKMAN